MKYALAFFALIGCSAFIKMTDNSFDKEIALQEGQEFSIVFSHNINGETHPCGCRKFPLGGLPQAWAQIKYLNQNHPTLYVDSGDTFFDTPVVADFTKTSAKYKAEKIAEALDIIGLKLLTPGDQDFALGTEFLKKLSDKHKFKFLITNAKETLPFKALKQAEFEVGPKTFLFLGVIDPALLRPEFRKYFDSPESVLEKYRSEFADKEVILLSHAGLDYDEKLAKAFPKINWIIGAHTQSFLSSPKEIGETKLVQVLSRNHYMGEIKYFAEREYELLEMRDETKDLVKPNLMSPWLVNYKKGLDEVYMVEQNLISGEFSKDQRLPTYLSCSECHTQQVEFWKKTSHSIAFSTLIHAKASNDPSCMKCHSVGLNKEFSGKQNMIVSSQEGFNSEKYWKEVETGIAFKHPVRTLAAQERAQISDQWIRLDKRNEVTHNFGNVQCLNCHTQDAEHPFSENIPMNNEATQNKCLSCHTRDQSPSWYNKDAKGLATDLNQQYFAQELKKVSCPKIKR